jgi:hypothetical protein
MSRISLEMMLRSPYKDQGNVWTIFKGSYS